MKRSMLAISALVLMSGMAPAFAHDGYRYPRGEYNRYNPDSRNPELERRAATMRSYYIWRRHHDSHLHRHNGEHKKFRRTWRRWH